MKYPRDPDEVSLNMNPLDDFEDEVDQVDYFIKDIINLDPDGYYQILTTDDGLKLYTAGELCVDENRTLCFVNGLNDNYTERQATADDLKSIPPNILKMFPEELLAEINGLP